MTKLQLLIELLLVCGIFCTIKIYRTISKVNLQSLISTNTGCFINVTTGQCDGICEITSLPCKILMNYNDPICGCEFCQFNKTQSKCIGRCSNLVLDRCISKVARPEKDSDCICASCQTSIIEINDPEEEVGLVNTTRCTKNSCFNSNCESVYVITGNNSYPRSLECICSN